ncbi:transposase [Flavobacterium covae]
MFISGNSTPVFRTIQGFIRRSGKMLVKLGYVSLEVQYIDGTKIEVKSNKYTFVWRGSVEKYKEKLETKINTILSDIENSIQSDNQELNKEELLKKINSEVLKEKLSELNKS